MDIQSQKQETVMTVLHLFMTLLQSYYQIKISRYSTTEKYYGNISVDNHGFTGVYCNFCHYLRKYPEFDSYFRKSRPSNINKVTVRYETPMGRQAQLDWKESIPFILSSGEIIEVNIFVLLLSYSRFRVYRGFTF